MDEWEEEETISVFQQELKCCDVPLKTNMAARYLRVPSLQKYASLINHLILQHNIKHVNWDREHQLRALMVLFNSTAAQCTGAQNSSTLISQSMQ